MPFIDPETLRQFASELKAHAAELGTGCNMPGCDNLTVGQRCHNCARRLCVRHAFMNLSSAKVTTYCVYCAVSLNHDLFADDADDNDGPEVTDEDAGVVDAEFEAHDRGRR
mgnify:CR=1 FL=1